MIPNCRPAVAITLSLTAICLLMPRAASAGVPQWPQKHEIARTAAVKSRPAPSRPRDHHEQLGRGFDGSDLFCAFAAVRCRLGSHNQRSSMSRLGTLRSSAIVTDRPLRATYLARVRSVDSLPAHLVATHLSI
jgi:hypothetical protein